MEEPVIVGTCFYPDVPNNYIEWYYWENSSYKTHLLQKYGKENKWGVWTIDKSSKCDNGLATATWSNTANGEVDCSTALTKYRKKTNNKSACDDFCTNFDNGYTSNGASKCYYDNPRCC